MKADKKYIIILAAIFVLLIVVEYNQPKPIDWNATYSKKDKIPYGNYVVYDYLADLFPNQKITTTEKGIYRTLENSYSPNGNYIIIGSTFEPDTLDLNSLRDYVMSGHNAFVSAEYFNNAFSDSLKFKCEEGSFFAANNILSKDSTSLNFTDPSVHSERNFNYRRGTVEYYFSSFDTAHTTVLGRSSKNNANFIAVQYGKGNFYVSTVPIAFTNYNALKGNNSEYISRALSYLPVADTYWDEYYKPGSHIESSPLRFILGNESLKAAYIVMIFSLLFYIVFETKRKQRIIPVITPLKNTSLEFVETIGRLYYQKGTRSGIAHKKIVFFLDYIRTRYNIATNIFNDAFYSSLASKTLIPAEELQNLFTFISQVQAANTIDEIALMQLNNQIETFYRKTK
ncbi:MAG TPA: DUF4350 domain-containing protein [Bacteroidia bacterium]|jgi:hypothetical protein|nr:DUF4350 domain-containing protein [Bacteroidia bacterium]